MKTAFYHGGWVSAVMTFTGLSISTAALLAATCAAVLVVLHLLRVRLRPVRVTTTLFWQEAVARPKARTLLRRFREPLAYAVLLICCLLLVAALTDPQSTPKADDSLTIVVLDAGASMAAPDAADAFTQSAMDIAKDAVTRLADRGNASQMCVVACMPWPRVVKGFEDSEIELLRRIEAISPGNWTASPDAIAAGVKLGRDLANGRSAAGSERILWVSNTPPAAPAIERDVPVEWLPVGHAVSDAGIAGVVFVPAANDPLRGKLQVRVANAGDEDATRTVVVRRSGGAVLLNTAVTLPARSEATMVVEDLPADGDTLEIELSPRDSVPATDEMTVRLAARSAIHIGGAEIDQTVIGTMADGGDLLRRVDEAAGTTPDILVHSAVEDGGASGVPTIVVVPETPVAGTTASEASQAAVSVNTAVDWVADLDFEGAMVAVSGDGADEAMNADWPQDCVVLLKAGERPLAVWRAQGSSPAQLWVAQRLIDSTGQPGRRPAMATFLSRAAARLAGWSAAPVALTAERWLSDPLWAARAGMSDLPAIVPGVAADPKHATADASTTALADAGRSGRVSWRTVLLLLAMAMLAVEAVLHARGRIA